MQKVGALSQENNHLVHIMQTLPIGSQDIEPKQNFGANHRP